MHVTAVLLQIR